MNIFESKYYGKIMFLGLIIVSLLILFSVANIMDEAKIKYENKSIRPITGLVTGIDNINNSINKTQNSRNIISTNSTGEFSGENYTMQSYLMYYILIVGIIAGIFITFSILRSTVLKNIEIEEKEREF